MKIVELWTLKVGPQSKMLGRSSITPCVLNVELDAELQGGFPGGVGEEPEAGCKALWVREVPEVHAMHAR